MALRSDGAFLGLRTFGAVRARQSQRLGQKHLANSNSNCFCEDVATEFFPYVGQSANHVGRSSFLSVLDDVLGFRCHLMCIFQQDFWMP